MGTHYSTDFLLLLKSFSESSFFLSSNLNTWRVQDLLFIPSKELETSCSSDLTKKGRRMFCFFRAGSVEQCYVETRWRSFLVSISRLQIVTWNVLSCLPLMVLSSVSVSMRLTEEKGWRGNECESITSVMWILWEVTRWAIKSWQHEHEDTMNVNESLHALVVYKISFATNDTVAEIYIFGCKHWHANLTAVCIIVIFQSGPRGGLTLRPIAMPSMEPHC